MRPLPLVAFLSLSFAAPAIAQKADPKPEPKAEPSPGYNDALARYQDCIKRLPFLYHTDGRDRLAQTRTLDGLAILIGDYEKPHEYPEYSRYTLATLFGRHFSSAEAVDALNKLRTEHDKPVDTWLWVKVLRCLVDNQREQEVATIAQTSPNMLHRAAAIAAIGDSSAGDLRAVVVPNCVQFPKKESDRNALIGAMSGAFWEQRSRINTEEYRDALKTYIGLLGDDVGLTHTAKVQIARHLQWLLNGPSLFINPEPWLELLARGDVKKSSSSGGTTVAPRFFGIETDGERLCYVVDMSDSMLLPIEQSAKPQSATGPVTGKKPPKKKKAVLDENDLPWDKINNRWDLAREQLRISLLRLTPDKHFAVVWFGDSSDTLKFKGMMKATKSNIEAVINELDSIQPQEPPTVGRVREGVETPSGRKILKGDTNMHSGIRRAFGLAGKGFVEDGAYVDPDALTEGCDTIFLLSDGAPTMDDFYVEDKDYGEGRTVKNYETGEEAPRAPRLWYPGPFRQDDWLVEDVRRMNAFRRIRMHCIGLGEANDGLMRKLAEVGHGEAFSFGKRKPQDAGGDAGPGKK